MRIPALFLLMISAAWSFGELQAQNLEVSGRKSLQFEESETKPAPTNSGRAPASTTPSMDESDKDDKLTEASACFECDFNPHLGRQRAPALSKIPLSSIQQN